MHEFSTRGSSVHAVLDFHERPRLEVERGHAVNAPLEFRPAPLHLSPMGKGIWSNCLGSAC